MVCGRGRSEVTSRSKNVSTNSVSASARLLPSTTTMQVALGGLPQQDEVQSFGGGGESGERKARVRIANQTADDILECRVAAERLKQIANCWVRH